MKTRTGQRPAGATPALLQLRYGPEPQVARLLGSQEVSSGRRLPHRPIRTPILHRLALDEAAIRLVSLDILGHGKKGE